MTRRDFDPTGTGNNWYHCDTITARLSYNGVENYEVILHNNQPVTNANMRQFGGTSSEGEFASMMKEIFEPETHTEFSWDHWGKLRGRKTYVFAYDVQQEFSQYHVEADDKLSIVPAYRGLVYIDEDTKMVVKIVMTPYDMPSTFPIHDITTSLDYDFETIGDQQYMLPLKSVLTSKRDRQMTKNDIEFRLYRKFGTESTIKFETPDPLPEDQTKEKSGEPASKVDSNFSKRICSGRMMYQSPLAGWDASARNMRSETAPAKMLIIGTPQAAATCPPAES